MPDPPTAPVGSCLSLVTNQRICSGIGVDEQDTKGQGHGDLVVGAVDDLDLVPGPDLARLDHAEVSAGPPGQREPLDPAGPTMPIPLARGGVTMTGPSTGRLSMPVSLIAFHGFSRGWPMLTDNSFMTRP